MSTDRPALPLPETLTVYGAAWCGDCRTVIRYLDGLGVAYRYVDLALDRDAQRDLDAVGIRAIPVITTPDGAVLIEPSAPDLAAIGIGADAAE